MVAFIAIDRSVMRRLKRHQINGTASDAYDLVPFLVCQRMGSPFVPASLASLRQGVKSPQIVKFHFPFGKDKALSAIGAYYHFVHKVIPL